MAIQFLNDIDLTGDLQLQDASVATSVNYLIPINVSGNSKLKIQGGNYIHRVGFSTSWPNSTGFEYALLTSSYNTSNTELALYKSDSSGSIDGTTLISTGNSYFNGNVGINTTSPSEKLHVVGNATCTGTVEAPTLYGNHADGNGSSLILGRSDTSNYWNVNHAGADFRLYNNASSGSNILLGVDPSGNVEANSVGIGTASPTEKLHVVGNVRVTGALKDSNDSPGTSGQVLSSTATGTDWIDLAAGGTVTSVATSAPLTGGTITTTGTIGITQATTSADGYLSSTDWNTFNNKTSGSGTADKVAKWSSSSALTDSIITATATQVSVDGDSLFDGDTLVDTDSGNQAFYVTRQGSTNESLKMYTTDTIAILQTIQDETTGVYGGMDFKMDDGAPSPRFRFTYGETTRMTIQSNGRVGIATTSPSQTFHVNGSSRCNFLGVGANAQGTPRVYLQQAASATTSAKFIKIKNTVALDSSGVRIMDFLDSDNTVRGFIHYDDTSTTYSTTSDYRLKENIEPIPNSIDKIKELKPCRFNFIGNDNKVDGFIAHEVQEVVKEAVTGEKDAVNKKGEPIHQGLDQSKIVPLLTAALKEAIDKIESLESRIQTLENK